MSDLSKLYGYNDQTMTMIITSVGEALGSMRKVNGQVMYISGLLPTVNNSTSGQVLARRINNWNEDYRNIERALNSLAERAMAVRKSNNDKSVEATQASSSNQ
jgi:hypothetical protein